MDQEKRKKNITFIAKHLAEKGREYLEVNQAVMEAAKEYNSPMTEMKALAEYTEDIEW